MTLVDKVDSLLGTSLTESKEVIVPYSTEEFWSERSNILLIISRVLTRYNFSHGYLKSSLHSLYPDEIYELVVHNIDSLNPIIDLFLEQGWDYSSFPTLGLDYVFNGPSIIQLDNYVYHLVVYPDITYARSYIVVKYWSLYHR